MEFFRSGRSTLAAAASLIATATAAAQTNAAGVTDTGIKIGQTAPYSGPASD